MSYSGERFHISFILIMRKTYHSLNFRDILSRASSVFLTLAKVMKNKERLKEC